MFGKSLGETNLGDNSEDVHVTFSNDLKARDFETEVSKLDLSNVSTQNFPEYILNKIEGNRRKSEVTLSATRPPYGKKFESSPNIQVPDESGQKVDEENLVKFLSRANTPGVNDEREVSVGDSVDEPVHYVRRRRRSSVAKYVRCLKRVFIFYSHSF